MSRWRCEIAAVGDAAVQAPQRRWFSRLPAAVRQALGPHIVRLLVGCTLLTAAALKTHQLANAPAEFGLLSAAQWFVVEFELLLGLWVLGGFYYSIAWLVALSAFAVFTCIALYRGITGAESCGCFGDVAVSPWKMFIVDIGIVTAMLVWRPIAIQSRTQPAQSHLYRWVAGAALCGFLGVFVAASFLRETRSHGQMNADIPGLYVARRVIDIGLLTDQETGTATFELANRGTSVIKIEDVIRHCGCTVAKPDRTVIEPGETLFIPVTVSVKSLRERRSDSSKPFRNNVEVRLRVDGQPPVYSEVQLVVVGEVPSNLDLTVTPGVLNTGPLVVGMSASRIVELRGLESLVEALPEQVAVAPNQETTVTVKCATSGSARFASKQLAIFIDVGSVPLGRFESSVILKVEGSNQYRTVIPIRGQVVNSVFVEPARLLLMSDRQSQQSGSVLRVRSPTAQRPVFKDASTDLPLNLSVEQHDEGDDDLMIRVVPSEVGVDAGAITMGRLTLHLSSPNVAIDVPVVILSSRSARD